MGKKSRGGGNTASQAASAEAAREGEQRQRERSAGDYDWAALFEVEQKWAAAAPALPKNAALPVASFCDSRIELRDLAGRGRGLVVSAPVAEGDLLFACRAFSIAARSELQAAVVERLRRCSQEDYQRFLSLQDGPRSASSAADVGNVQSWAADPESHCASSSSSKPRAVDAERVSRVLRKNSVARDVLDAHGSAGEAPLCGLWLLPSLVNHSCRPNVQQSFLGDLLVARAAKALAAGEELLVAYVSTLQPQHVRRERLTEVFDFNCSCPRCTLEAALLPSERAKTLLSDLDALVAGAAQRQLQELADNLDVLCQRARREASEAASKGLERIGRGDAELCEASRRLWGGSGAEAANSKLEHLLRGSFLPVFMGSAFARKRLEDAAKAADAFSVCADLLASICPGSAYHAHWSLEWVLQAHRAADKSLGALAGRALRWCRCFAGADPAVFQLLAQRVGWPKDLIELAKRSPEVPEQPAEAAPAEDKTSWQYSLEEGESAFTLSISLPEGLGPADVDLDVAPERVSVATDAGAKQLEVALPRRVDPSSAPPAKYKRKGNRLLLELPLA